MNLYQRLIAAFGALALLVGVPAASQAQHHHAGFHGGFAHHGGYAHHGFYHHDFDHHAWWYPRYYVGSPYYGWPYYSYPYSYYTSPYYYYQPTVAVERTVRAPVSSSTHVATVDIRVPSDADVWVEGMKLQETGSLRQAVSPPLDPGQLYHYDVRARWLNGSQVIDQTRTVTVQAGQESVVDFLSPAQ